MKAIENLPVAEQAQADPQRAEKIHSLRDDAYLPRTGIRWWELRTKTLGRPAWDDPAPSEHPRWNEAWAHLRSKLLTQRRGEEGAIVVLCGETGRGKTALATGAGLVGVHALKSTLYNLYFRVGLEFEEALKPGTEISRREVFDDLCKPWLLILDEVSAALETDASTRILRNLLTDRHQASRPTVLVANYAFDSLGSVFPEQLLARMNRSGAILNCDWEALRE
jgi:hypothetical protein